MLANTECTLWLTNSLPLCAWPRKKPTTARMEPRICVGTCHRDLVICDCKKSVAVLPQNTIWSRNGGSYTKDHADWEDDAVCEHLDEDVDPENRVL